MSHTDKSGRPYAKLSEVKEGDIVELDDGFDCHDAGNVEIQKDEDGLFFECAEGRHHIDGQADDGEHLVGIYALATIVDQKID